MYVYKLLIVRISPLIYLYTERVTDLFQFNTVLWSYLIKSHRSLIKNI